MCDAEEGYVTRGRESASEKAVSPRRGVCLRGGCVTWGRGAHLRGGCVTR